MQFKIINLNQGCPFGSLIEMGLIKPGTILFDEKKKKYNAKIMVDGSLKCQKLRDQFIKLPPK